MSTTSQTSQACRLIINWDEINMWAYQVIWAQSLQDKKLEPHAVKALIEHVVDEHAKVKIDRLVHCLFSLPWGTSTAGFKTFNRAPERGFQTIVKEIAPAMTGFDDEYDLADVLLERSKKDRMQFLAGLRMNDRHPNSVKSPFYREHPQWQLNYGTGNYRGGMDYKYEGVRHAVLAFIEELLDRYDVDGIEFDWMRWCHVFQPAEAQQNAELLTDFMVKTRKLLDEAAGKRGRDKLVLGVRIPQTIHECKVLGFDVKAWTRQARLDYICPTHFHFMDFNIKVEDYVAFTEGTSCKVYPSINPILSQDSRRRGLTHENFRAAAKNFYAYGAQGVSTYNFYQQYKILPGNEAPGGFAQAPADYLLAEWPRSLEYLTAIRDPKAIACGDRHYLFHPLQPEDADVNTGVRSCEIIKLVRAQDSVVGSMRLRMAEDLKSPDLSATLEFKITGMEDGDQIEVQINDQSIAAGQIDRSSAPTNGQPADQGRVLPAFYLYRIPLSCPPARFGDNELRLRLTKSFGTETLIAQEFEVRIRNDRSRSVNSC